MHARTLTAVVVDDAVAQALAAAESAGIHTRVLDDNDDFARASRIFNDLWGTGPANSQMPAELVRALTHSGSYAGGAFVDGELIGAAVGFLGRSNGSDVFLHSHILGVRADAQARNVGFALKQHQRAWALERGLTTITWTFDPLVRRNAYFNVQKLAVHIAAYYENFYGPMTDNVNAGDESDRVLASWDLAAPATVSAAAERSPDPDIRELVRTGSAVILDRDDDGAPRISSASGSTILCAVPDDVLSLRSRDGEKALAWRRALRVTLGAALHDGFAVRGFARSGWYVLARP